MVALPERLGGGASPALRAVNQRVTEPREDMTLPRDLCVNSYIDQRQQYKGEVNKQLDLIWRAPAGKAICTMTYGYWRAGLSSTSRALPVSPDIKFCREIPTPVLPLNSDTALCRLNATPGFAANRDTHLPVKYDTEFCRST
jgi:hypothetical protein